MRSGNIPAEGSGGGGVDPRALLSFPQAWEVWSLQTCGWGLEEAERRVSPFSAGSWRTESFLCTLLGMFCEPGLHSVDIFLAPHQSTACLEVETNLLTILRKKRPGWVARE